MASRQWVRIWKKKTLRLDHLTFPQRDMVTIGLAGLEDVKRRIRAHQGPNDGPAKPLTPGYARLKSRKGLSRFRDLTLSGQMLNDLKLRTVTDNQARASVGATARAEKKLTKTKDKRYTKKGIFERALNNKDVAKVNQERETWLVFSPANKRRVVEMAMKVFKNRLKGMVVKT